MSDSDASTEQRTSLAPPVDRVRLKALRYAVNEESAQYIAVMRTFTGGLTGLLSDQSAAEVAAAGALARRSGLGLLMTVKNRRHDDLEPALPSLVKECLRRPVIGDEMGEVADLAQVVKGPHSSDRDDSGHDGRFVVREVTGESIHVRRRSARVERCQQHPALEYELTSIG